MTAPFWTESIGVSYEVLFVYCFEYADKSGLNEFVFKTWYPQGALFVAAGLRYVLPPDRLRPVCHHVQPCCKVCQVCIQVFGILFPGHFVNAGGCILPQPLEAFPQ